MTFRYEKSDGVGVITLDNPPVNVLTPQLHKDLFEILKDFYSDPEVRVGIWTAAGERAFCAGDDVKTVRPPKTTAEIVERHLAVRRETDEPDYPGWEGEIFRLQRTKPIIAAVNGVCLGQGMLYLLLMTDLRIASSTARFGLPEIGYGMPGGSAATRLGRQIPQVSALYLALTGDPMDAEEARRCFLINEVVAPERLLERAHEIAARIIRHPAIAVRAELEAYYRAQDMSRDDALAFTTHLYQLVRATFDSTPPLAKSKASS